MLGKTRRRIGAVALAASLVFAAPAAAHFCSKSGWSDAALEHASKAGSWLTADEWLAFIAEAEEAGEICPAGAEILRADIASRPDDTLFMGPGLLAGGAQFRSKAPQGAPDQFQYVDFEAAFAACGGGEE